MINERQLEAQRQLRALSDIRKAGPRGVIVPVGNVTHTQHALIERGEVWQEIYGGGFYKLTLSPTGRQRLEDADADKRRTGT